MCKFEGKVKNLGGRGEERRGEERRRGKSQKCCHRFKKNQKTSHKTQTQNQRIITKRERNEQIEQLIDWVTKFVNFVRVNSNHRGSLMDGSEQHHLRGLSPKTIACGWLFGAFDFTGWLRRGLFRRCLGAMALFVRHVAPNCYPFGPHHIWHCRG